MQPALPRRTLPALLAAMTWPAGPLRANPLAENPALARIAANDRAAAEAILIEARRLLAAPAGPRLRGRLSAEDFDLLQENPILREVQAHDPAAGLALLERVRMAGGGRK